MHIWRFPLGVMLFGVSVLRHKSFPAWMGVVLVTSPAIFTAVMVSEGPEPLGLAANIVEAIALMAMGRAALRSQRMAPDSRTLVAGT